MSKKHITDNWYIKVHDAKGDYEKVGDYIPERKKMPESIITTSPNNDHWNNWPGIDSITIKEIMSPKKRIKKLTKVFEKMLKVMDIDQNSIHFKETPERMARMYVNEVFKGLYFPEPKFTVFDDDSEEMVFLGGIDVHSTCGHHFAAIKGTAAIGYIPNGKLVGISKLARITDYFARRPQVQEMLVADIADYLMEKLKPKGLGVYIAAQHGCIIARGAMQNDSIMKTTALRGCFLKDKTVAEEFYRNISL